MYSIKGSALGERERSFMSAWEVFSSTTDIKIRMKEHVQMGRDGLYAVMFTEDGESEECVRNTYNHYGEIAKVKLAGTKFFVSFYKEADAQRCLEDNPKMSVPTNKEKKANQNGISVTTSRTSVDNYNWREPVTNRHISHHEVKRNVIRQSFIAPEAAEKLMTMPWETKKLDVDFSKKNATEFICEKSSNPTNFELNFGHLNSPELKTLPSETRKLESNVSIKNCTELNMPLKARKSENNAPQISESSITIPSTELNMPLEARKSENDSPQISEISMTNPREIHFEFTSTITPSEKDNVEDAEKAVKADAIIMPTSAQSDHHPAKQEFSGNSQSVKSPPVELDCSSPPPLVRRCPAFVAPNMVEMIVANFPDDLTDETIWELTYRLKPSSVGPIKVTSTAPKMNYVHITLPEAAADILATWNHLLFRGHRLIVASAQELIEEGSKSS